MYRGYDVGVEIAAFQNTLDYQSRHTNCTIYSFPGLLEGLISRFERAGTGYFDCYSSRNVDNSHSLGRRVDLKVEGWSMLRRGISIVKDVLQETSNMTYKL